MSVGTLVIRGSLHRRSSPPKTAACRSCPAPGRGNRRQDPGRGRRSALEFPRRRLCWRRGSGPAGGGGRRQRRPGRADLLQPRRIHRDLPRLRAGWARCWVPINTASRGTQLQHVLANSGATLLIVESELLRRLITQAWRAAAEDDLWADRCTGRRHLGEGDGQAERQGCWCCDCRVAVASRRICWRFSYTSGTTGLSKERLLHRHAQYFWWGHYTAHLLGRGRAGCPVHDLAGYFDATNAAQHLLPGPDRRRHRDLLRRASSVPRFWEAPGAAGAMRHLPAGRHGADAAVPSCPAPRSGRIERGSRWRPERRLSFVFAEFFERTGIQLLDGYGLDRNKLRHRHQDRSAAARAPWAASPRSFVARAVDGEGRDVPDGEQGELILRSDEPLAALPSAISRHRTRPAKPGARAGSIREIA